MSNIVRALLRVPASGGAVASALIDVLADCDDRGISVSVECDGDRFTAGQSTAAVVTQLDVVRELIATDNVTSAAIVCVGEQGTCYIRITLTGHTQTFLRVAPGIQVSDTGPSDTNRTVELTWNVNDSSEQPLALA